MVKHLIKQVLLRMGYQLVAIPRWSMRNAVIGGNGYRLVSWTKDSKPDLEGYQREQEKGNRAKIGQVWTNERNLRFLCQWLVDHGLQPKFIVCHGTRNGFEQRIFSAALGCEVVGTEISSTASQFPMTVRADFHDSQPQWQQKADVIYSNSLDHAYDPGKALRAWADCVRDGGVIVLEKASDSDVHGISDLDPFGISLPNLLLFLLDSLGDIASIRAVIDVPQPKEGTTYHRLIVVRLDRRGSC